MQQQLSALIAVSTLALGLGACTQEQSALNRAPGTYERTTSSTDAKGTTTKQKSSTEISMDEDGKKKAMVKSKTTVDPKGLFNKTTTSEYKQVTEEN